MNHETIWTQVLRKNKVIWYGKNMEEKVKEEIGYIQQKFNRFLRIMEPGLITGAADDDPSGTAAKDYWYG